RCDIDKVLGPLFTVLSGQPTTLPYQVDPGKPESARYAILPITKPAPEPYEFAPGKGWRLLATINSLDKASLYQMSYALMRRFAWIHVDVPADIDSFIRDYALAHGNAPPSPVSVSPLGVVWRAVIQVRRLGPAPFIDVIRYCRASDPQ